MVKPAPGPSPAGPLSTPSVCAPPVQAAPASAGPALTVLYDGACPLCRREIGLYRGLPASVPLCLADVSDAARPLPAGTTRAAPMARFHVIDAQGRLIGGASAFLALWAVLPGWRWLARAGRLPGVAGLMELVYRLFLHVRPRLQRLAASLERRG